MATAATHMPVARRKPRAKSLPLWPLLIVAYASLLPAEIRIAIGDFQLYAYRMALFALFPWVVIRIIQGVIRLVLPDLLVIFTTIWMAVAMMAIYGAARGLQSGGVQGFDMAAAYFLARVTLGQKGAFERMLVLMLPGALLAAGSVMLESITHQLFVRSSAISVFGNLPDRIVGFDHLTKQTRMGLMRAPGPFPHSILAGLQLSSFIALYFLSRLTFQKRLLGALAGILAIFSLSSAGIMGILLNFALVIFEFVQRKTRDIGWRHLMWVVIALGVIIQTASENGLISVIIRYLTFDPATGYYRTLIWQYAGAAVMETPWFGLGFESWDRPGWMISESIDAHWLFMAVRFGLPAAFAMGAATFITIVMLARAAAQYRDDRRNVYVGVMISLVVMSVLMFTVTLWGGTLLWFMLLLGFSVARMLQPVEDVPGQRR